MVLLSAGQNAPFRRHGAFVARKEALTELIGEDECVFAVEEVKHLLGYKGHYSRKRVQAQIDAVMEVAEQNKVDNVRQKTTGVDLTMMALELVEFSKLKKDHHTEDLKTELQHRGCNDLTYSQEHPQEKKRGKPLNFTDLKNKLKVLEKERVQSTGGDARAVEHATKAFKKLSSAEFKMMSKN